jgi:hypothetical protein
MSLSHPECLIYSLIPIAFLLAVARLEHKPNEEGWHETVISADFYPLSCQVLAFCSSI